MNTILVTEDKLFELFTVAFDQGYQFNSGITKVLLEKGLNAKPLESTHPLYVMGRDDIIKRSLELVFRQINPVDGNETIN